MVFPAISLAGKFVEAATCCLLDTQIFCGLVWICICGPLWCFCVSQDEVTVVGYPEGGDNISVTQGIVSRVAVCKLNSVLSLFTV